MYYLIGIFFCGNYFFWLVPGAPFGPARDAGLLLILLGLAYRLFLRKDNIDVFLNSISFLLLLYFVLVAIQVPLASINYNQTIMDGILAVRHDFYFLSFFLFLLMFKTLDDFRAVMNVLSWLALLCVALGLINYFGPTILDNGFVGKIRMRGGINQPAFPGMTLITMMCLWNVARWFSSNSGLKTINRDRIFSLLFIAVHVFVQARFRMLALVLAIVWPLVLQGNVKRLAVFGLLGGLGTLILQVTMETNILLEIFLSGAQDVADNSGTADDRLVQLEVDLWVFNQYPFIGGGASAIRIHDGLSESVMSILRRADMGYTHWLKFYGITGMTWLLLFFISMQSLIRGGIKGEWQNHLDVILFARMFFAYLLVSFITMNNLMFAHGIITVCMLCAFLVRSNQPDFYPKKASEKK